MTVKYRYRASTGVFGWFQCDDADFRAFWRAVRRRGDLYWVVVQRGAVFWVWSGAVCRWYQRSAAPSWCPLD